MRSLQGRSGYVRRYPDRADDAPAVDLGGRTGHAVSRIRRQQEQGAIQVPHLADTPLRNAPGNGLAGSFVMTFVAPPSDPRLYPKRRGSGYPAISGLIITRE